MRAGVSSWRPTACVSAATSLPRMPAAVVATGMEPRGPPNLTRLIASARLERGQARGRRFEKRVAHRGQDLEDQRELADLENLLHQRLDLDQREIALLGLGLLGGEHEDAQAR